jgi:HD-GYP domain-containing protein (c-di-GMP phosphodiesterase class II)/pSer/pThr/pTyr-binding forkhead associated (FHA) protein
MKLVCIEGQPKDHVWQLTGNRAVIGRDPHCDIVIEDPMLSRIHAEVVCDGEALVFNDRESQNGSYINNEPVTCKNLLPGDVIRLGDTTLKAVEEDLPQKVCWQEYDPLVTSQISLDGLPEQLKKSSPRPREAKGIKRDQSDKHLKAAKLIKNLQTIYEVGKTLSLIRNVDEMLEQVAKTLLEVFHDAERLCILVKGKSETSRFEPKIIKTRHNGQPEPFRLSRSIFQKTVKDQMCIIATDASDDERFVASQSIMTLQLRSVMCAPLISKGNLLGVIYLDNRNAPNRFDDNDLALLSALANQSAIALENSQLYEEVQKAYHEVILALMNTVDAKDPYTRGHSRRTSHYAVGIAREMGLSKQDCNRIKTAAELHDIGKIGVGDFIMGKEDPLSTMEFNTIKAHVLTGESIVQPIKYLHFALPMIRHHHEHYDGTGYPDRLKGDEIPLGARIIGAADAFDAMTTQRPYNKPLGFMEALKKCVSSAGKHFDPNVIDGLVRFINKTPRNGAEAHVAKQRQNVQETRAK